MVSILIVNLLLTGKGKRENRIKAYLLVSLDPLSVDTPGPGSTFASPPIFGLNEGNDIADGDSEVYGAIVRIDVDGVWEKLDVGEGVGDGVGEDPPVYVAKV